MIASIPISVAFLLARYGNRGGGLIALMIVGALWMFGEWVGSRRDHARIRTEVARNGDKLISILVNPASSGWLMGNDGVYEVTCEDCNGKLVLATCKTTQSSGVEWLDRRFLE